jgi:acetyl esterase
MKLPAIFRTWIVAQLLCAWCHVPVFSQSCSTGSVDERADKFLKSSVKEKSMTELRAATTESIRKEAPAKFRALPKDSVTRIKITGQNISANVVKASVKENQPVIIHFHEGGFVLPLQPWMEYEALHLARKLNAVVFDVDYRVAPENKFPAAHEDAYQAYLWVLQHAKEHGGNPDKIYLAGREAGANLAASTALKARKEGKIIPLAGLLLICPSLDNPMISFYPSLDDNATGYSFTKDRAQFGYQSYLDKPQWFAASPEAFPLYEKDLTGLPPALIITTEFDVLRDEGIAFGKKLEQAGNKVIIKCYPHQLHNFRGLPHHSEEWSRVYELMGEMMK